MTRTKKLLPTFLRVGITAVGLWLAAQSIDLRQVGSLLAQGDWRWAAVAFLLINASLVLRAYRWLVLLRGLGVQVSFGRLVALYFVGNFFNAFLPSGFGGDAVRVVEVAQEVGGDVATGTVFLDRFTGLLTLFGMGLLALPLRPATFPAELAITLALLCGGGLVAGGVVLDGRLLRLISGRVPAALGRFVLAVERCGRLAIGRALAISLLFNLLLVGWWTAVSHALGTPVTYGYNLLVVPIFAVALLAPSIGGLGVREVVAVPLLVGAGLGADAAVAISLLEFILMRLASLLGAGGYGVLIWQGGGGKGSRGAEGQRGRGERE